MIIYTTDIPPTTPLPSMATSAALGSPYEYQCTSNECIHNVYTTEGHHTDFLSLQNSRYYFYVNATHMKYILCCALFRFSSKIVCHEDGICFIFGHICINIFYLSNTANLNKRRIMVTYIYIFSIRYNTKHVCLWFFIWKFVSKCLYVFKKNKVYVSANNLSGQTIVYFNT